MASCPAVLVIKSSDGMILRVKCAGPVHRPGSRGRHRFRDTGLNLADMSRFRVYLEEGNRG